MTMPGNHDVTCSEALPFLCHDYFKNMTAARCALHQNTFDLALFHFLSYVWTLPIYMRAFRLHVCLFVCLFVCLLVCLLVCLIIFLNQINTYSIAPCFTVSASFSHAFYSLEWCRQSLVLFFLLKLFIFCITNFTIFFTSIPAHIICLCVCASVSVSASMCLYEHCYARLCGLCV
jgi:hypothetical protein